MAIKRDWDGSDRSWTNLVANQRDRRIALGQEFVMVMDQYWSKFPIILLYLKVRQDEFRLVSLEASMTHLDLLVNVMLLVGFQLSNLFILLASLFALSFELCLDSMMDLKIDRARRVIDAL